MFARPCLDSMFLYVYLQTLFSGRAMTRVSRFLFLQAYIIYFYTTLTSFLLMISLLPQDVVPICAVGHYGLVTWLNHAQLTSDCCRACASVSIKLVSGYSVYSLLMCNILRCWNHPTYRAVGIF